MTIETTIQALWMLVMSIAVLYLFLNHLREKSLEEKITQEILIALSDVAQEAEEAIESDFERFRERFQEDYVEMIKKLAEINQLMKFQAELLVKNSNIQQKKINDLTQELHKTQNMLARCKKKLQRDKA